MRVSETDDHVGAGFGFDPGRLRWHCHVLIGHLEQCLNHRLADIEHYIMFIYPFLLNDARHVFQSLHHLLAQNLIEDLLLQAHRRHLLKRTPGCMSEVYPVELVVFLHDDLVLFELVLDGQLGRRETGDLETVYFAEFGVDVDCGWDVRQDSMLRMHHHVLTRVQQCLDPLIFFSLLAQQVILMGCMHPMMAVQDIQTVYLPKLFLQSRLLSPYFPQRVLPSVTGVPPRKHLILLRELQYHPFQGQIFPVTDDNRSHMLLLVGVVIEMRAVQGFLVSLDPILMVVLS